MTGNDCAAAVNLVNGSQLRSRKQRGDREAPVAGDRLGIVIAAEADVEARAFADRHAAAPAEEAVREVVEADRPVDLDVRHRSLRMMMSSSA